MGHLGKTQHGVGASAIERQKHREVDEHWPRWGGGEDVVLQKVGASLGSVTGREGKVKFIKRISLWEVDAGLWLNK